MKEENQFATKKEVKEIVEREIELLAAMTKHGFDEVFRRMDERFEALEARMDKKFDLMEKRFDLIDKRFEAIEKRLDLIDERLDLLEQRMDQVGLVYVKQVDHAKLEKRVVRLEGKFA